YFGWLGNRPGPRNHHAEWWGSGWKQAGLEACPGLSPTKKGMSMAKKKRRRFPDPKKKPKRTYHRVPGARPQLISGGSLKRIVRGSLTEEQGFYRYCTICRHQGKPLEPANYYCKIKATGQWAYLCKTHMQRLAGGLGTGKGQQIRIDE